MKEIYVTPFMEGADYANQIAALGKFTKGSLYRVLVMDINVWVIPDDVGRIIRVTGNPERLFRYVKTPVQPGSIPSEVANVTRKPGRPPGSGQASVDSG